MIEFTSAAATIAGFFCTGAAFALGFATVCRVLKWAPINVNVTVNNPPGHSTLVEKH